MVMSRIQISLPTSTIGQLHAIADSTGEPVARVGARLLVSGLTNGRAASRARSQPREAGADAAAEEPTVPPWLEPFDDEERRLWRQRTWGDAVALCGRYPTSLEALPEFWWRESELLENVCALAAWRMNIDCAGQDPRDELAFHNQLADFRDVLRRRGGGVTKHFKPGAPHDDWITGW
jgi:hypothetical protein